MVGFKRSLLFLSSFGSLVHGATQECPQPTAGLKSVTGGSKAEIKIINHMLNDAEISWMDASGNERPVGQIPASGEEIHHSFAGHAFRVKDLSGKLLKEFKVKEDAGAYFIVNVKACGDDAGVEPKHSLFNAGRDVEFEGLTHDQTAECGPEKNKWSCVRHVTKEELEKRSKYDYGFTPEEVPKSLNTRRQPFQVKDDTYYKHIPKIPHLTPNEEGNGFLKMNMTQKMQETLLRFYSEKMNTKDMTLHEPVAGYYSNNHAVDMDKIDLDRFQSVRRVIIREMQQVLQWWTLRKLTHTSTFGARIYRKDAMLINHVDRADTHLASAVLQVAQDCPEGEGWPLEVITTAGEIHEVYMQPGEMVLYEGARLFHGRPMRSNCTEFGNVFTHFAPLGYHGPRSDWDHMMSVVPGVEPRVAGPHKEL